MSLHANFLHSIRKKKPLVAVAQMCSTNDKEANFQQLAALAEQAKKRGAEVKHIISQQILYHNKSNMISYISCILVHANHEYHSKYFKIFPC